MLVNLFVRLRSFASSLFHRSRIEGDLDEELRAHIQNRADDLESSGLARAAADRRACLEFGGCQKFKEEVRETLGTHFIDTLLQDVRHSLRTLRKAPGFTMVAVLTLALGIGANTAIFSVVEGVLLTPLPFSQPNRLVIVWQKNLTLKKDISASYPDFQDWQRSARSFQEMAAVNWQDYDLTNPGKPEHVTGMQVSSGFLSILGVEPILGREFSPQEDVHGGAPVVLISHHLWETRFAGSPNALGKSVTLEGTDYTIVGVLPSRFRFDTDDTAVITPLGQGNPLIFNDRTIHPVVCVARLKSGVTMAQSKSEMSVVQNHLNQLYPAADRGLGIDVTPLKQEFVGDVSATLLLLLGFVGLVLLIACANVASLFLARSAGRAREFAVRSALGANRSRIVRQLLTESVILSLIGGILGLVVAKWTLSVVLTVAGGSLPRSENIGVNVFVLLFTFGISIAVGILFGLAPAVRSSKTDLQTSLKEGGRGSTASHHRAQGTLVIVQMALALVILVGAGLLFRTIHNLRHVNPGFDTRHVITCKVGLSASTAKTPAGVRSAYQQLVERIRELPGIQAADLSVMVPLNQDQNIGPFFVGTQEPASMAEAPRALFYWTGPDYLPTMQIPLLRGRYFTADDTTKSDRVVVIDSVLAGAYFPGRDPLGQVMTIPHWGSVQVVGVVGHVRQWALDEHDSYTDNQIYASLYQLQDNWAPLLYSDLTVIVRTRLDLAAVMPAIKSVLYAAGGDQPVYRVKTMQKIASDSMSPQRFPMILLGAFASLALVLASVGIYGVVSYSVAQREHEVGIRMALGAERWDVFRMVIGQGLRLALAGVAIGGAAALILARLLPSFSHLLYGVQSRDPLTFLTVCLVLVGVSLAACYIPARRAMQTAPMNALRHE